ncbi:MAG: Do family serine endopeptidase [Terriglobia bacterium]
MQYLSWAKRLRRSRWEIRLAVGLTLAVGILLGTLITNGVRAARNDNSAKAEPLAVPSPVELSSVFRQVAQEIEGAVVNISTETIVASRRRRSPRSQEGPDPFRDFFDRFFTFPNPDEPDRFRARSLGSGVIVDQKGYILTNLHVVADADVIEVRLPDDNKEYRAEVVGQDSETDLAVIKIDAGRPVPYAKLGNSDAAQVGDWVLAIGSPFGLKSTVTAGIISYKGREGGQQFQRFLQTDAAINRGNSGGPLVNLAGEVIGINTAIMSSRGLNAGVGFALPSNTAIEVYNQIIEHGRVVRGSIGIRFRGEYSQNQALLSSFGTDHGVVVDSVLEGGPADRAGLRRGDVLTEVDGQPIETGDDLVDRVAATPPGQKIELRYIRERKQHETTVEIEERTKLFPELRAGNRAEEPEGEVSARLGLTLDEFTASMARRVGLEEEDAGLAVVEVEPGSFADEIGVLRQDLILEFNHQRVRTLEEFQVLQRKLDSGSNVVFWLKRRTPRGWISLWAAGRLP